MLTQFTFALYIYINSLADFVFPSLVLLALLLCLLALVGIRFSLLLEHARACKALRLIQENRKTFAGIFFWDQSRFLSTTLFAQSYHQFYTLAVSLGAQPLLHQATLQQIALSASHSVTSYDCRPQVLEFLHTAMPAGKADADSSSETNRGKWDNSNQADTNGEDVNYPVSTAIAVTVYGQSRDLMSETDPLFFEVALNMPISVSLSPLHGTANK